MRWFKTWSMEKLVGRSLPVLLCLFYPDDPSVFLLMNCLPDRPKNMRPDTALVELYLAGLLLGEEV